MQSLQWWMTRFDELKISHSPILQRGERTVVDFEDIEGQRLSLVDDGSVGEFLPWSGSPVPARHQIRGLGPVTITVPQLDSTGRLLTEVLGLRLTLEYADPEQAGSSIYIYEIGAGGAGAELHVRVRPDLTPYRPGAGGVHHIAFRVANEDASQAWVQRLRDFRIPNSGQVNRYYFKSIYFREPNQILFELATDGPGFAVDENISELGNRLALPPLLEGRRAEIETNLKPLTTK